MTSMRRRTLRRMRKTNPESKASILKRMEKNSVRVGTCRIWGDPNDGKDTYGFIKVGPKRDLVHRVKWRLFNELPDRARMVNTCGSRRCINLKHWMLMVGGDQVYTKGYLPKGVESEAAAARRERLEAVARRFPPAEVLADLEKRGAALLEREGQEAARAAVLRELVRHDPDCPCDVCEEGRERLLNDNGPRVVRDDRQVI